MNNTIKYCVGQTVLVRFNGGELGRHKIEAIFDDIKDGEPGCDLSGGRWCYIDQIVK